MNFGTCLFDAGNWEGASPAFVRCSYYFSLNVIGTTIFVLTGRPPEIAGLNFQRLAALTAAASRAALPELLEMVAAVTLPVESRVRRTFAVPCCPLRRAESG